MPQPKKKKKSFLDAVGGDIKGVWNTSAGPDITNAISNTPVLGTFANNIAGAVRNPASQDMPFIGNPLPQNQPPAQTQQTPQQTQQAPQASFDARKNQPIPESAPYIQSQGGSANNDPRWFAQLDSTTYSQPFSMDTADNATKMGVYITLKTLAGDNADPDAVAQFTQQAHQALMGVGQAMMQNGQTMTSIDYWQTLGTLWQNISQQVAQQKMAAQQQGTTPNPAMGNSQGGMMTPQGYWSP
jgi:hypothetical protein